MALRIPATRAGVAKNILYTSLADTAIFLIDNFGDIEACAELAEFISTLQIYC
ncbi:MAG: hypothetical protein ABJG88_01955 [Litorimonas sp.]